MDHNTPLGTALGQMALGFAPELDRFPVEVLFVALGRAVVDARAVLHVAK